MIRRLKSDVLD